MRIFVIEAYGGREGSDGPMMNFAVHAATLDEAIGAIRSSPRGQRFGRFEVIEETSDAEGDGPEIIAEYDGPYVKPE
jgi:hypothetical protein